MTQRQGWIFVVSSPSGGGKTTLVQHLLHRQPGLRRSVSVTTRPPRHGERRGKAYQFISRARFAALRRRGALLEWAKVHGAYYGTPRRPIDQALAHGRDVVLNIDVQGARQVRRLARGRAVLIFLLPRSLKELARRLMRRRTDSPAGIQARLRAARRELACARWYDYTVVNGRLQDAVDQLEAIVIAQRCRTRR